MAPGSDTGAGRCPGLAGSAGGPVAGAAGWPEAWL